MRPMLIASCLFAVSQCALAQVSLRGLDRDMVGPRAQILVLGTVHLNRMPATFHPAALDGVLDRLAAFRPDIITIEALKRGGVRLRCAPPCKVRRRLLRLG